MLEHILTIAAVAGAAVWFLFWLRSTSKGGGCSCGKGDAGCCGRTTRECACSEHKG